MQKKFKVGDKVIFTGNFKETKLFSTRTKEKLMYLAKNRVVMTVTRVESEPRKKYPYQLDIDDSLHDFAASELQHATLKGMFGKLL